MVNNDIKTPLEMLEELQRCVTFKGPAGVMSLACGEERLRKMIEIINSEKEAQK